MLDATMNQIVLRDADLLAAESGSSNALIPRPESINHKP
jgi:hypothetical protein